jgi:hypothetical protein
MRGRPRKTTDALIASGTFRPARHTVRLDNSIDKGRIIKPRCLKGLASKKWDALMRTPVARAFAVSDLETIKAAAFWAAQLENLWKALGDAAGGQGELTTLAIAQKQYNTAAAKLGLTPVDRARLEVKPEEVVSEKARFFKTA